MTQLQSIGSPLRVAWSNHTLLIIRQQTPSFQRAHLFFHHRPAGAPQLGNEGQAWGKEGPCAHYLTPSPVAARDFLSLLSPDLGKGFPTSGQTLTLSSTYILLSPYSVASPLIGAGCTEGAREPGPFCTSTLVFGETSVGGKGGGPTNLQAVPQILEASHLAMVMVTG